MRSTTYSSGYAWVGLAVCLCTASCGNVETTDGGATQDASTEPDGGAPPVDAGPTGVDAGVRDAATMDAGPLDGGPSDGGSVDGGPSDGGDAGAADGGGPVAVGPLFPSTGSAFMACVADDGPDDLGATGTLCDLTNTSSADGCFHAGALRSVELTELSSCVGVTITDALGVFDWICDDEDGTPRAISTGFADGKRVGDLIDPAGGAWRTNSVTATNGTDSWTSATTAWWTDPIVVDNDGGTNTSAGTIYLVTEATSASYLLRGERIGFVIMPGVTLMGNGTSDAVVRVEQSKCGWFEGAIDASGHDDGLLNAGGTWDTIHQTSVRNATNEGLDLNTWKHGRAQHVVASNNQRHGLQARSAYSRFTNIEAVDNLGECVRVGGAGSHDEGNVLEHLSLVNCGLTIGETARIVGTTIRHLEMVNGSLWIERAPHTRVLHARFRDYSDLSREVIRHLTRGTIFYDVHISNAGAVNAQLGPIFVGLIQDNPWPMSYPSQPEAFAVRDGIAMAVTVHHAARGAMRAGGYTTFAGALVMDAHFDPPPPGPPWSPGIVPAVFSEQTGNHLRHLAITDYPQEALFAGVWAPTITGILRVDSSTSHCTGVLPSDCAPAGGLATVEYGASGGGVLGAPDFALSSTDSVLLNRTTAPTGDDVITHRFGSETTTMSGCLERHGTDLEGRVCTTQFLRDAYEIFDDGVGNDDGLCQSGEDCIWMRNIGAYQGHGDLVLESTIGSGGTLEDIRLYRFAINGR